MVRACGTLSLLLVLAGDGFAQQPADSIARSVDILRRPPPAWLIPHPTLLSTGPLARGNALRIPGEAFTHPGFRDSFAAAIAIGLACGKDSLCESELQRRYQAEFGGDLPIGATLLGGLLAAVFGAPDYRLGEAPVPSDSIHIRR